MHDPGRWPASNDGSIFQVADHYSFSERSERKTGATIRVRWRTCWAMRVATSCFRFRVSQAGKLQTNRSSGKLQPVQSLHGHKETIGERFERDLGVFLPPRPSRFDACETTKVRVGSISRCATRPTATRCRSSTAITRCWSRPKLIASSSSPAPR
jgi:hypothetical protein